MMLDSFGEVLEMASLENYNTYGIKTSTKYLVKPYSIDKLRELLKYLKENKLAYLVLGGGSNTILPDTPFNGVIISLASLNNVEIDNTKVVAECGIPLANLASLTIENNLGGLHYLALIPGSLGGALYGNAGSYNHDIYEYVESVEVIRDGKLIKLSKDEINVSYRYTSFKETNDIIVKSTLNLEEAKRNELLEFVASCRMKRRETQPLEFKNAGSVFKNPEGDFAGRLIESVDLKGYRVGDAEVSTKHANFIINKGNATSKDIKTLIAIIQEKVYNTYGIELELEQKIIEWD